MYDVPLAFDFTNDVWTQTPDCGYDWTNSFAWEGSTSTDAFAITGGSLVVSTSKRSLAASHEVKLVNTLTIPYNGPGGSTTFTPASDADKVVYTIVIEDPCLTATIDDVVFLDDTSAAVTSASVTDGGQVTVTFTAPSDSVTTGQSSTTNLCGNMNFGLYLDTSDTALDTSAISLSGPVDGVYTIHLDTSVDLDLIADQSSVTKSIQLKTRFNEYGN